MISEERARKLIRDLRQSRDDRHDREILRKFESELDAVGLEGAVTDGQLTVDWMLEQLDNPPRVV